MANANFLEVDSDLYDLICRNVKTPTGTDFMVLRRLPKLNDNFSATSSARGRAAAFGSPSPEFGSGQNQSSLGQFLASGRASARTATETYLRILGFVHSEKKDEFEKVMDIKGRERAYFGRTPKEITDHGLRTHPHQIHGTKYWALTNASTDHKRAILEMVLRRLGYPASDVRAACSALC